MPYKVFLVEDETITREGIRDNVDWEGAGFLFCGEAPDGEVALPLIEEAKPDVLITDIKMPFMDGLQLSKVIREYMPWVKVVILSGHDEFEYAQAAVKLGVTDYLLKPVSASDLHKVLGNLSIALGHEKQERERLKQLQERADNNLSLNREKFLLELVTGEVSAVEAIELSQQLGLDLVAKFYLVVFITIQLCEDDPPYDFHKYQGVEKIVSDFVHNTRNIFFTKKDLEEFVLLVKGDHLDQLVQEGKFLAGLIKEAVEKQIQCNLVFETGSPQSRLSDLHHSFTEALVKGKSQLRETSSREIPQKPDPVDLIQLDRGAIENYLKFGLIQDYDDFFATHLQSISAAALRSEVVKHYLFVDILLSATQFMSDLGGGKARVETDLKEIENLLGAKSSLDQIKHEIRKIIGSVLDFRDNQANHERDRILCRAIAYIDDHFADPQLKLSEIASRFNISLSHFSMIFHQETGETFTEYLSRRRMDQARTLLRTTNLKIAEIAFQCGFNDPHYFSTVFKKKNGSTPQGFRDQSDQA